MVYDGGCYAPVLGSKGVVFLGLLLLRREDVEKGDVFIIYKHFPLFIRIVYKYLFNSYEYVWKFDEQLFEGLLWKKLFFWVTPLLEYTANVVIDHSDWSSRSFCHSFPHSSNVTNFGSQLRHFCLNLPISLESLPLIFFARRPWSSSLWDGRFLARLVSSPIRLTRSTLS